MARSRARSRDAGRLLAIIGRAIFLGMIVLFGIIGWWDAVLMYGTIFVVTLPLLLLAKDDGDYYLLDIAILGIFLMAAGINMLPWPSYHTAYSYDKFYHAAGGAWVAGLGAVLLRKRVSDKLVFYTGIIVFAVAIGAFWEVFEWVLALLPQPFSVANGGLADTMMDIIADTAGAAVVAVVLALRRYI